MQGIVDAGVTWQHLAIPPADNSTEIYVGAKVKHAPHPRAAAAWLYLHPPAKVHCHFTTLGVYALSG